MKKEIAKKSKYNHSYLFAISPKKSFPLRKIRKKKVL